MKKAVSLGLALVAVAGIALLSGCSAEDPQAQYGQPSEPAVRVYRTELRDFHDRIEALGTLRGRESVTITANITERVAEIHFEEGERVEQGQLLLTLFQDEQRAQLAGAQAELVDHEREVERLEGLVRTQSAAQTELDRRRTERDKARHRIEELQAQIADRNLRAPFAGVLGLRQVSPGALVSPGDTITTLDDIDTLKLDFSVPARLLGSLRRGQELRASTSAYDGEFTGTVEVIDSRVNPVDRSIRARALFDNPDHRLKPGMLMQLELHYNPREAIVIPEEALVSRERRHSVWVVDPQSRQGSEREVRIGSRRPGWVEITEGLEAGELVVRRGLGVMREGVAVDIRNGDGGA